MYIRLKIHDCLINRTTKWEQPIVREACDCMKSTMNVDGAVIILEIKVSITFPTKLGKSVNT